MTREPLAAREFEFEMYGVICARGQEEAERLFEALCEGAEKCGALSPEGRVYLGAIKEPQ